MGAFIGRSLTEWMERKDQAIGSFKSIGIIKLRHKKSDRIRSNRTPVDAPC